VKSRYFREEAREEGRSEREEKEGRSRRWGHTRIEHERKGKGVSLNIVSENYLNRFYPVANLLYYKVIDLLSIDLVNILHKHQTYVQQLLRLLSVFAANIGNFGITKSTTLTGTCY
jgi:hypothetical protein